MFDENVVLCVSNSYEKKYDFNPDFDRLPEDIKNELKIMCVLFTEEVGGILDMEFDEELEYKIVGSTEANSLKGKISNESPVGKALLGKKIGDTVTVTTPAGEFEYKILSIHRSSNE